MSASWRALLSPALLGALVVACGGGGETQAAGTDSAPPAVPTVILPASDIAWWGDSLTFLCASALQEQFPGRKVLNGGVSGEASAQILDRVKADLEHKGWINVFWFGHNDSNKEDTKAKVAAAVSWLAAGNKQFVVLPMLSWSATGYKGSPEYSQTLRADGDLAAAYGDNFLDIRSFLVGLYDPANPGDVQDHLNDITPGSLRFDTIHLNGAGCQAVARRLKEFIAAKGW